MAKRPTRAKPPAPEAAPPDAAEVSKAGGAPPAAPEPATANADAAPKAPKPRRQPGARAPKRAKAASEERQRGAQGDADHEGEHERDSDRDRDESERDSDDGADEKALEGEVVDDFALDSEVELAAAPVVAKLAKADAGTIARWDPLQAYMRDVSRYSLLKPDEEHDLAVKLFQQGDVDSAARLVTANLRLVVKIAYDYRRAYRNLMDLIQEGNIGLMQAVKKYDPYRGVKLSSYAAWWIRAYILRFILNNWRLVKIGTTQAQRKLFFNLSKEKAKLAAMGIEATPEEIAKRLDVTAEEVTQMDRRLAAGDMSLDAPVGNDEGRQLARVELMPSKGLRVDDMLADEEIGDILKQKIHAFGARLAGKDAIIFQERLLADDPKTLQELGERFGVSRERVRQLEKRLQEKLKRFLREELGDEVLSS